MSQKPKSVIVVDMQKDNVGRYCLHIIPKIRFLLEKAREKGILVVYSCDTRFVDDKIFVRLNMKPHTLKGSEGWKIIDELKPSEKDFIVEKPMLSAFFSSNLDFLLRERGVKELIVCGVRTEGCVLKTVLDAFELGYDVTIPVDCVASPSPENHESTLKILDLLKIRKTVVEDLVKEF